MELMKGDYVWIPSNLTGAAGLIGAKVLEVDKDRFYVHDDYGREMWLKSNMCLSLMHPTSVQGVENMIDMGDMHEAAALRNLSVRFGEKLIYTYAGSILIAVNPYKELAIYSADMFRLYKGRRIGELPPHVFAIAEGALRDMMENDRNCCVIISGESGSGKTETAKLVLQYLAVSSKKSTQHLSVEERILEANPVLEAFGNAKTLRNDNSSRFGRFTDISFGDQMRMESAMIEPYLLETSRIVSQALQERNFHIFYCLLAGLTDEELVALNLDRNAASYHYLCQSKQSVPCDRDDASDFQEVCFAMKVLYFSDAEMWSIFTLLAAILHLGNIRYTVTTVNNHDATEIKNAHSVILAAKLLQVDQMKLVNALTTRTISTKDECVITSMNAEHSLDMRDALAKAIYGRLFASIIDRINLAIKKHKQDTDKQPTIGLLDIFGFENFQRNSFEQFCINYASETLQQFFIRHVFKFEEEMYLAEGIDYSPIEYADNGAVLDLIAYRSFNIFNLLDEESVLPNGNDASFLTKAHQCFVKNAHYLKPKSDLSTSFTIVHYTGHVIYQTKGFVEKNRDRLSADLLELIGASEIPLLNNLFARDFKENKTGQKMKMTTSFKFRKSLDMLMYNLDQRQPFFIRCMKPNDQKRPMVFDRDLCFEQLMYLGIMDTIQIRMLGYPIRLTFAHFVRKYKVLISNVDPAWLRTDHWACEQICRSVFKSKGEYRIGHSQIFLKDRAALLLEQRREKLLYVKSVMIQKHLRAWIVRQKYLTLRNAAVVVQKNWRCFMERRRYKKMLLGFSRLQAVYRSKRLQCEFLMLRMFMSEFQALCRGLLLRRRLKHSLTSGRKSALHSTHSPTLETIVETEDSVDSKFFDFLLADLKPVVPEEKTTKETILPNANADNNVSAFKFSKFAAAYFIGNADAYHSRKLLRSPLLQHEEEADKTAALHTWATILRFMGDYPANRDVQFDTINNGITCPSILIHLIATIFRNKRADTIDTESKKSRDNCTFLHYDHALTTIQDGDEGADGYQKESEAYLRQMTAGTMDKLHFIIGHGILRPKLRDEIFCQICKQLNNNSNLTSLRNGWVLLSLCLSCFAPSDTFVKYLRCFMRDNAPEGYAIYCEQKLNRTLQNGNRAQPPSYYELRATKERKALLLPVTLMNGTTKNIVGDSAITAKEVCQLLEKSISLQDSFGFSLYIALSDKVSCLGSEGEHVLDAISQCEQYAKEIGSNDQAIQWRLFFRLELFTPWHCPADDPVATDLIYHQVTRGLKFGEYQCNKSEDLAYFIAMQYYVDYDCSFDAAHLRSVVQNYIPDNALDGVEDVKATKEFWIEKVLKAIDKHMKVDQVLNKTKVKHMLVTSARLKWPLLFSKFYEAYKLSGSKMLQNEVIVAVNWTGVYVVDNKEQVLVELTFVEIMDISWYPAGSGHSTMPLVRLEAICGDEYSFQSPSAIDIVEIITTFLDGLRRRSKFLIALMNVHSSTETSDKLLMKRGDLIKLENDVTAEMFMAKGVADAENLSTTEFGTVHSDDVYPLATLNKPPQEILEVLCQNGSAESEEKELIPYEPVFQLHTLEQFASKHFRCPLIIVVSNARRQRKKEELWCHDYEPITKPLLRKVLQIEELCQPAIVTYAAIMKYMGDVMSEINYDDVQHVEKIFSPPLKQALLRDEVYCQIIKQLTNNPSRYSVEKGWELLWLCCGLFAPSRTLYTEVARFLRTRCHPVAADCFNRIQKAKRAGPRKFAPHEVEIEAIQRKTSQVFHKIYFPDGSVENVQVESSIRAKELLKRIAKHIGLKNTTGFSLFIKFHEKILSITMDDFFFDFIRSVGDLARKKKSQCDDKTAGYQIYMMKKLWVDTIPGKDFQADVIFHYPQELPKYLRGYHKCTKEEAGQLASLIYRASYGDNQSRLSSVSVLNEIVPQPLLKALTPAEWKKLIFLSINKGSLLSREEAKVQFLKLISKWPTFGSTFFDIKQSSITVWPEKLLLAVNKDGILIINGDSKEILDKYPFGDISNWSSGNTYFHLTIGGAVSGKRLLCETAMGYKVDDLLTSYISHYLASCN